MLSVEFGGERLVLLADKAAFLPDHATLLVADAHVGKAVSFRRLGVPVPRGTTTGTLERIGALVERLGARRVVFLGDFLHSSRAHAPSTLGAVARWRQRHAALDLVLVRGNHDDRAGDPPAALRFTVVDEPLRLAGLALCHHPQPVDGAYALAGHLHPCVTLPGRAGERLRLPCFHFGQRVGVLPAFGEFTGMHPADLGADDRVFAVADECVIELPRR